MLKAQMVRESKKNVEKKTVTDFGLRVHDVHANIAFCAPSPMKILEKKKKKKLLQT